ncbi:hypothetical protein OEA41_001101 [Lepraria neglecta]|uniref:NAD-dependent epimerase/dehydratase domain-containing protein n=1 Tax=Lepraria neglecta TaxID=209136 RepID=A0AAE0DRQ5_9LECA|nr:hypothetical protein OEA41_001101 [Lepraria neglecta]
MADGAKGGDATSATATSTNEKPAVLIIGGLGYIGRFLALYIHRNNLASEVRLVDKVLPQLARLPPEFAEACSTDKFMQADANREQSLSRIFTLQSGRQFSYVFNCGGETRYSQDPSVYAVRSTALTNTLATYIAGLKPSPALVEFGTGMVYKPPSSSNISSGGCSETAALKPWLKIAKAKLQAEEALEKLARGNALKYVCLRLAHVYGEYDVGFLARGLCLARVYQGLGRELKWLWTKDLRINTVHVLDVCNAAWKAAQWCAANPPTPQSTMADRAFNIVDMGDTKQETLSTIVSKIFNIETGFQGSIVSQFAKLNLDNVVDDVNEDILQPWADMLKTKGLDAGQGSPLTPFMEKELLKDHSLCLDGKKARETLAWTVERDRLTEVRVKEILESYERMRWWP